MSDKQQLGQIVALAESGEIAKAFQSISGYIQAYRDDEEAVKIYQKLKKQVYQTNLEKVKESIDSVKFMWKQKRYKDLLHLYLKLREYAPNYKPLQKLIQKAYKAAQKDELSKRDSIGKQIVETVDAYIKNKKYSEALQFLENTIMQDPNNPLLQKLLLETKHKIIDQKLAHNKSKLKKSAATESYDFIKKLYELEPNYYKTQQLYAEQYYKLKDYYKNQKFIFEKEAKKQITILFNTKEFEKALQASQELIRTNLQSKTAKKFIPKIQKEIDKENFKKAYAKIST